MSANLEMHRLIIEQQTRFCYFLLTISSTSIGFYIQKLDDQPFSWHLSFLISALLCWGASFYLGCLNRVSSNRSLHQNFLYLQSKEDEKKSDYMTQLKNSSNETGRYGLRQGMWLLVGVCFVILWHISRLL
jgi:hypothetical protein